MSAGRPTEQWKSWSVTSALPVSYTNGADGVNDKLQTAGSAHLYCNGAGLALFEITAVNGLTGTVEVILSEGGTWRQWDSYQRPLATAPTKRAAGTTITLTAGDMIFVDTRGVYAVRFKRAAGTSATITIRSGESADAFFASLITSVTVSAYTTLLDEALPSIASSTQLFANAPAGTQEIWVTLRTAGMTLTTDAGAATAGANGNDFSAGTVAPHVFTMNQAAALLCRAIQNGGTATGWIVYRG